MAARRPKPPDREPTVQIAVRVPASLVKRIDAHAERLREQSGVPTISRTDALLAIVGKGLEIVEVPKRSR